MCALASEEGTAVTTGEARCLWHEVDPREPGSNPGDLGPELLLLTMTFCGQRAASYRAGSRDRPWPPAVPAWQEWLVSVSHLRCVSASCAPGKRPPTEVSGTAVPCEHLKCKRPIAECLCWTDSRGGGDIRTSGLTGRSLLFECPRCPFAHLRRGQAAVPELCDPDAPPGPGVSARAARQAGPPGAPRGAGLGGTKGKCGTQTRRGGLPARRPHHD